MTFEVGQSFAHFKIIRKLGEGGMGEVYLAEDQKLNRNVAIKILLAEFFDDPERMKRFTREAKTAAKISHSNVMAIYDMDSARDEKSGRELSYIVMEHVGGETLTDYLQNKSRSTAELLRISEKIASGLASAHKLNIVHRDIKSDNIKIDENADIKILDFGLAKPIDITAVGADADVTDSISKELTQEGKILGTVTYMSPEQARGEPVDTRSDIFSFGVLLYRMFAGEFPFEGREKVSVLAKILETKHIPIRQKDESLPAELERIIDKCLQKDPNDRYQDTRDLVVDLRSLRRQYESGISDSVSVIADMPPRTAKGRLLVTSGFRIGFIALALALIAIILYWVGKDSGTDISPVLQAKENALAILGFDNKTGDQSLDWLQAGLPEILLTDLAQNGAINIISRNRILDCLSERISDASDIPSHKDCIAAAKSLGAVTVLSGSFYKLGEKIRIDARLEDVETGRILLGEKVVGDDPFVLVDSLTQKVAQSLNMKEFMVGNKEVAALTSSSPEAYKYYILGMEKFDNSRYDEAIELFEKAIEVDSTFALPYMRIGMSHRFQGRQKKGTSYFALAKRFEDKLPRKDKNFLDIYVDMYFKAKFDDAFVKLKTFISNYPDDKEVRSMYALFLYQMTESPDSALAQLDTVLMLDKKYQPALTYYATIHSDQSNYDEAIRYSKLLKKYYPESPTSYQLLAGLYWRLSRFDDAIQESRELLDISPGDRTALMNLSSIYILKHDFKNARRYAEILREKHADDPYVMMSYYDIQNNLANWEGKFVTSIEFRRKGLEQALSTGDSSRIFQYYNGLAESYIEFGMPDSALFYAKESSRWATVFQSLEYPFILIHADRSKESEAREVWDRALNDFKARVPNELWPLGDVLGEMFDASCRADTSDLIATTKKMLDLPFQEGSSGVFEVGRLLVLNGQYEEGKEFLQRLTEGARQTSNGLRHIRALYHIGIADEALGNTEEAIANYREVLKYWNDPEIELKEIADTKKRLSRLVS